MNPTKVSTLDGTLRTTGLISEIDFRFAIAVDVN